MKLTVVFKTPDAVDSAVDRLLDQRDKRGQRYNEEIEESIALAFEKLTGKFVRHGELVSIEFDINKGTATVLPL